MQVFFFQTIVCTNGTNTNFSSFSESDSSLSDSSSKSPAYRKQNILAFTVSNAYSLDGNNYFSAVNI